MIRVLAAALLLGSAPLHAQLSNLLPKEAPKQAEATESPQQMRDRWQAWLTEAKGQLVRLDDPAAESQLPSGITISGTTFAFDALGRPTPGPVTVTVSGKTFTVEAETGYVHP